MTVRRATKDDVMDIVMLTHQFLREFKGPLKFDARYFADNLDRIIENDNFFFHVAEDEGEVIGFLAGAKNFVLFSTEPTAIEIGWFMEPAFRNGRDSLRLLSSFEQWARDSDCSVISMGDLSLLQDLGPLYTRRGYELYERTYIKRIK